MDSAKRRGNDMADARQVMTMAGESKMIEALEHLDAGLWLVAGGNLRQALEILGQGLEGVLGGGEATRSYGTFSRPRAVDGGIEALSGRFNSYQEELGRLGYTPKEGNETGPLGTDNGGPASVCPGATADPNQLGPYAEIIADRALPLYETLLGQALQGAAPFSALLPDGVHTQALVARAVCQEFRSAGAVPFPFVLKTLRHQILLASPGGPPHSSLPGRPLIACEQDWMDYADGFEKRMNEEWDDSVTLRIPCPACGSSAGDGSWYEMAYALLEDAPLDENRLVPCAFRCLVCGLDIPREEGVLAKHFATIPEEAATKYLKDMGNL